MEFQYHILLYLRRHWLRPKFWFLRRSYLFLLLLFRPFTPNRFAITTGIWELTFLFRTNLYRNILTSYPFCLQTNIVVLANRFLWDRANALVVSSQNFLSLQETKGFSTIIVHTIRINTVERHSCHVANIIWTYTSLFRIFRFRVVFYQQQTFFIFGFASCVNWFYKTDFTLRISLWSIVFLSFIKICNRNMKVAFVCSELIFGFSENFMHAPGIAASSEGVWQKPRGSFGTFVSVEMLFLWLLLPFFVEYWVQWHRL